jgi:hypothetical protein
MKTRKMKSTEEHELLILYINARVRLFFNVFRRVFLYKLIKKCRLAGEIGESTTWLGPITLLLVN